ncbi:hypothetical protein [Streptomyces coeruleorubidus]|uniref:hypothetical protein n=1 Tax=Streptomyces coeruleorubidus TaxID=116188 RepID=UPI00123CE6C6|nr:hypothetical protein [Streptomyces coeruleorubidus]
MLAVVGIYGDSRGWWDDRGFLTNLLSSMTSVFFGVPSALIFLGRLGSHQAEVLQRRAVQRRARLTRQRFREAVLQGFASQDLEALKPKLAQIGMTHHLYKGAIENYRNDPERRATLQTVHDDYERLLSECIRERSPHGVREWRGDIVLLWRTLDEEIRPRVEELGLTWLSTRHYLHVRESMAELEKTWTGARPFTDVEQALRILLGQEEARRPGGIERARSRLGSRCDSSYQMTIAMTGLLMRLDDLDRIGT